MQALRTLLSYVIGAVQVEYFGPLSGEGTAALATLPRDLYPFVADTAIAARRLDPRREFRAGLEAVLRGLIAAHTRPRGSSPRRRKRARKLR